MTSGKETYSKLTQNNLGLNLAQFFPSTQGSIRNVVDSTLGILKPTFIHHNKSNKDPHASLPHFPNNCNSNLTHHTWYIHSHWATRMSKWSKTTYTQGMGSKWLSLVMLFAYLNVQWALGQKTCAYYYPCLLKRTAKYTKYTIVFLHLPIAPWLT